MTAHGHRPVVIVGAGGHGREIFSVVRATGRRFLGFVDDGQPDLERIERLGTPLLGRIDELASLECEFVIGVGNERARQQIAERLAQTREASTSVIHPTATVGPDVTWGAGFVAFAHAAVTTNVRLGAHTHLNQHAAVAHDCRVGSYVTVGPGARLSGNVAIGDGTMIGAAACVLPGVSIGRECRIGAGAVVTNNVPDRTTAIGVPARW